LVQIGPKCAQRDKNWLKLGEHQSKGPKMVIIGQNTYEEIGDKGSNICRYLRDETNRSHRELIEIGNILITRCYQEEVLKLIY
jgi:hypothetical protein